ncbi:DUF7281 domain-containing protein [Azomonas macrocytogenes]|uniref:DUF7281 domain-containing protein n=1 Tax=Azomonas macrocytogenes TaxID=69962 RepID=A0A839T381_AZOMA|nr:hypothetical protein [Azomonas macrocytogenes]MBB3103987.1 hypothetical protein [Azomonas macrocytogenes]
MRLVHNQLRKYAHQVKLTPAWREIHTVFDIGEIRGNQLYLPPEQQRILAELAHQAWGIDPLEPLPTGNRVQAAATAIDEKIAPTRPDENHVLVKGRLPAPLPVLSAQLSLRVPLSSLDLAQIRQVLIIENLDSFDDWQEFSLPPEIAQSLVLYRGHNGLAKGLRTLLVNLPQACRITVFPDWDLAGLQIAHTLPRADALLVPRLSKKLLEKGHRGHFIRQHRAARYLDTAKLDGWNKIWLDMKEKQISIKQQHMLALASELQLIWR